MASNDNVDVKSQGSEEDYSSVNGEERGEEVERTGLQESPSYSSGVDKETSNRPLSPPGEDIDHVQVVEQKGNNVQGQHSDSFVDEQESQGSVEEDQLMKSHDLLNNNTLEMENGVSGDIDAGGDGESGDDGKKGSESERSEVKEEEVQGNVIVKCDEGRESEQNLEKIQTTEENTENKKTVEYKDLKPDDTNELEEQGTEKDMQRPEEEDNAKSEEVLAMFDQNSGRVIDSRNSCYSDEGYIALHGFPGEDQSREVQQRDLERDSSPDGVNEEADNDLQPVDFEDDYDLDEGDGEDALLENGNYENDDLAQLIVKHVIGNAVTSFNVDESSTATENDIEEYVNTLAQDPNIPSQEQDSEVLQTEELRTIPGQEDHGSNFVVADANVIAIETKPFSASTDSQDDLPQNGTNMDTDLKNQLLTNGEEEIESKLSHADKEEVTAQNEIQEKVTLKNQEEITLAAKEVEGTKDVKEDIALTVNREDSIDMSDTECGSMGRLPKLSSLPAYPEYPQNYGNYKVCRPLGPGLKECIILETGECIICKKSKESGITVITCTHKHAVTSEGDSPREAQQEEIGDEKGEVKVGHEGRDDGIQDDVDLNERQNVAEMNKGQNVGEISEGQTVADILQSMNFEIIDVKATVVTPPLSEESPRSLNSSMDSERKRSFRIQRNSTDEGGHLTHEGQRDTSYSNGDTRDRVTLNEDRVTLNGGQRSKMSSTVHDNFTERSSAQEKSGYLSQSVLEENERKIREREMLLEQQILEKVRRDMAKKEKQMRERLEQEMHERSDQQYKVEVGDLSSIRDSFQDSTIHVEPEPYSRRPERHRRTQSEEILSENHIPRSLLMGEISKSGSSPARSDSSLLTKYNREVSSKEKRHGTSQGVDTYARLYRASEGQDTSLVRPSEDELGSFKRTIDNLPKGDVTEEDRAILSDLYIKYNIPPPQYIPPPQSSFKDDSSRISSDLEAPPPKSGSVPPFKTLQEQQLGWMRMFRTLEEHHQYQLKTQYRQHQESIFKMQQQMENELFNQQQSLRKKLAAHKEVLNDSLTQSSQNASLNSGSIFSPGRGPGNRDDEELLSTSQMLRGDIEDDRGQRSPDNSRQSRRADRSPTHERYGRSPPWREIYRNIRGKGIDSSDTETDENISHQRLEGDVSATRGRTDFLENLIRERIRPKSAEARVISPSSPRQPSSLPRGGVYSSPMPILRKENPPRVKVMSDIIDDSRVSPPRTALSSSVLPHSIDISSTPSRVQHSDQSLRGEGQQRDRTPKTPENVRTVSQMSMSKSYDRSNRETRLTTDKDLTIIDRSKYSSKVDTELSGEERLRESPNVRDNSGDSGQRLGSSDLSTSDDMSSSLRSSLREKHAKHLADLREYYEEELRDLRTALSVSADVSSTHHQVAADNNLLQERYQTLVLENQTLQEKNLATEKELEKTQRHLRETEQKLRGLEKRAMEYADHYKEAQDKISTFRNKVEELQFSDHQHRDNIEQLEYKVQNQADTVKHYKKVQEEQMEVIQKDRNAYHKLADKYENMERDISILKDTLNSTENNLYDARKEIVELNRTVSKLELENKRLGRENDNIRYKATQHINMSSVQNSLNDSQGSPGRAGSLNHPRDKTPEKPIKIADSVELSPPCRDSNRVRASQEPDMKREWEESRSVAVSKEMMNEDRSSKFLVGGSRSKSPGRTDMDQDCIGDIDDTSPVMRAERELFRLREIMRQTDHIDSNPSPPKLQKKKYYGSEVSKNRNSDNSSISSPKIRRKKDAGNSPNSKSSQIKITQRAAEKNDKSKELLKSLEQKYSKLSHSSKYDFDPNECRSPSRFDVSSEVKSRSKSVTTKSSRSQKSDANIRQKMSENGKGVDNDLDARTANRANGVRSQNERSEEKREDAKASESKKKMPGPSLDKKTTDIKATVRPQTAKERVQSIQDLEQRYDNLQSEKTKLDAALSRVPLHGKGRKEKEQLEEALDCVEKELGSVRMSLKRYHVLKTSI